MLEQQRPDGVGLGAVATEVAEAVQAIGAPLARILNRYAPARRLAGVSDEAELGFAAAAYFRRNLAERGRLATAKREREEAAAAAGTWPAAGEGGSESAAT